MRQHATTKGRELEVRRYVGTFVKEVNETCLRSQVEGSRIRNILSDFGAFLAISQNTLIPLSHVHENLMKI